MLGWFRRRSVGVLAPATTAAAAEWSVAIAGDNINSPITLTEFNEERFREILRQEIPELARTKGIPEAPLRAVLERLGEKDVPLADIPVRLAAAADELIRLRADLARLRNDRPEFAAIRARASALIDQGDFDAARALLREGREAARVLREEVSRSEAAFLADEARINRLQLNSDAALENLAEASRLDPGNTWVWIDLGDLWLERGSLTAADKAYAAAMKTAIASGDERDHMITQSKITDIRIREGDRPAALAAYKLVLDINETLARRDPGNTLWQRDLIVSCVKIAGAQPKAAPVLLQRTLDIAKQLQASGKLAPVDAWIPDELERRLAEFAAR